MSQNFTGVSGSTEKFRGVRMVLKIEGEVYEAVNIPPGLEVEVHQYLTPEHLDDLEAEGALDELEQDEDGAYYSVWIGKGL